MPFSDARRGRRGSVYMLVLAVGTVLTVIGLSMLSVSRAGAKSMGQSVDHSQARLLAASAVDHAIASINADANWRSTYAGQTVAKTMGGGTLSWRLVDDAGANLTAGSSGPFAVLATGTVQGAVYTLRVHMSPGGSAVTTGIMASTTVAMGNSSVIDSYDSSLGPYGGANVGSSALVQTNATTAGAVSLGNSASLRGSIRIGPGGEPDSVVSRASGSTLTGAISPMSQTAPMPTMTAPTGLGASIGNRTYSNSQVANISTNLHVNNLTVRNSAQMCITGNVTILVEGNLNLQNSSRLDIQPGASLTMYVRGTMTFGNSNGVTLSGANLSRAKFIGLGSGAVTLSNSSSVTGVIIAPNSIVTLGNSSQVYGVILARQLNLSNSARFHEDKNITTQADPVSFTEGAAGAPTPDGWNRVVE